MVRVSAYVLDSHRPYHHSNVIDQQGRVFIVDDGCKSFQDCPTGEDVRIYTELNCHANEDSEGDSEDDSEDSSDGDEIQDENGQEGGVTQAVEEMKEAKHMEEVKQELADLKSEDEEEIYEGVNKNVTRPPKADDEDGEFVEDPNAEENIDSV